MFSICKAFIEFCFETRNIEFAMMIIKYVDDFIDHHIERYAERLKIDHDYNKLFNTTNFFMTKLPTLESPSQTVRDSSLYYNGFKEQWLIYKNDKIQNINYLN